MKNLTKILKALADKNRIRIIKLLQKKELCVCQLAYILEISQPSVSRHLKKLKKAGLVETRQEGFWTVYYLNSGNKHASVLLGNIKGWLDKDLQVKSDRKKIEKAKKEKLCN